MTSGLSKSEFRDFKEYVHRLEKMTEPSNNDIRYGQYVHYVNCVVSKFVDERAYLVGSTAERTKLAFSKDDGDADILIVSGKLQVPVENLEYKVHNPCYVWIQADDSFRNMGLEVIDGRYLSARSLRQLRPELYTMMRAVHSQMTASFDKLPDAGKKDTLVTVPSKVGLASTKYIGLKMYGYPMKYDRQYRPKDFLDRSKNTKESLIKRWEKVKVHESDTKMLQRVFKALKIAKHPGGRGENNGQVPFVAQVIEDSLSRQKLSISQNIPEVNGKEKASAYTNYEEVEGIVRFENDSDEDICKTNITENLKVTYTHKHHRDFVPALKIKGDIGYFKEWRNRVKLAGWTDSRINDVYSTDVFVVSRTAPVNPNIGKDFCISFNLAERKLVQSMTCVQRRVFLLLKCFLKGTFEEIHTKEGLDLRLKTYHIKTLLLWLYESYHHLSEIDDFETVYILLQTALDFLRTKLTRRELLHYFIPYNLFIDFEEKDFRILVECVDTVRFDTNRSIQRFFSLDDNKPTEISLTPEETRAILDIMEDGGRRQLVDKLEDALIDVYRGFNESKRDEKGRAPIKEAIIDTFRLFLDDEKHIDLQIFKQINDFLTVGVNDMNALNLAEVNKRIEGLLLLLDGLGMFVPKIKEFMKIFSGRPGLQNILQGAFTGKPINLDKDPGDQILETLDRYMTCNDEEADTVAAELKYKLLGYFSGRKALPHLSNLLI